jgi:gluconate 2-dehydrogenase alpha chain
VVGRNYAYQTTSSVNLILKDKILNPFIATGAHGMIIDDYNGDNFDHGGLGFFGGGYMGAGQTNARPIQTRPVPKGTPKWGAQWKTATAETFQKAYSLSTHGSSYSYKDCYLDLDPTYKDRFGRPLMRMTFDFHDNEIKMSAFLTDRLAEIAKAMDPAEMTPSRAPGPTTAPSTRPPTTPAAP